MTHISNMLIPALIFYIVAMGLSQKKDIYACFTKGAKDGMKTVAGIVPTLIGLMIAVGVLRASGFLEFAGSVIGRVIAGFAGDFPNELVSLFVVKLFSASAATGLAIDIFKEYGTDSFAGLTTSLALASTETVFYTMSVYFMAAKVTKTKWTLAGALLSTFSGLLASLVIAGIMTHT
ncbi:MAG: spore maturation protein [Lachnospiraceae bacterium]|nr:spore maturation protein [Lachnospiraceae bacterium]